MGQISCRCTGYLGGHRLRGDGPRNGGVERRQRCHLCVSPQQPERCALKYTHTNDAQHWCQKTGRHMDGRDKSSHPLQLLVGGGGGQGIPGEPLKGETVVIPLSWILPSFQMDSSWSSQPGPWVLGGLSAPGLGLEHSKLQ